MSCEARRRDLIAQILALAGIMDLTADDVICVGIGQRYTRRGQREDGDPVPVQFDQTIRAALPIHDHTDDSPPVWARPLLSVLHRAWGRGNRYALLTLLLLTGGWHAVTPQLTVQDIRWLRNVHRMKIPLPPMWEGRIRLRQGTTIEQVCSRLMRTSVLLATILDARHGMPTASLESTHTVTPQQVMQVLRMRPVLTVTDLQRVLHAIHTHAPVVTQTVTWMTRLGWQPGELAAWRDYASPMIGHEHQLLQDMTGIPCNPTAVYDPSPALLDGIARDDYHVWFRDPRSTGMALTILFHYWQTHGRNDAIASVMQPLVHALERMGMMEETVALAQMLASIVDPPHGDGILMYLGTVSWSDSAWDPLTAGAIYAAACQRAGHRPVGDGIDDALHRMWPNEPFADVPSSIPVRAVGHEHDLVLPVLDAARTTKR